MPTWLRAMLAPPPAPLTPLARYTLANGLFYLAFGLAVLVWPGVTELLGAAPLIGPAEGLARVVGFSLMVIGWFYVMGARTNADTFGLATVADRIVVPFVFAALVLWGGVDPYLVGPIAVLDPTLALGAWWVWRRQQA